MSRRWFFALVAVWQQILQNYEIQDLSKSDSVEMLARTALEALPLDSIVIVSGDLQVRMLVQSLREV